MVDDHQIVIDGLKLLLSNIEGLQIIAEATSAEKMLVLLKINIADILITDVMMPQMNGFELSLKIKKEYPHIKILVLSMNEDGGMITKMIEEAGVDGYIPKASGKQELIEAINYIMQGDKYFSKEITEQYETYTRLKKKNFSFHLTGRELQVIECMMQHLNNKEIASKLFITERTVETHRKNIFRKTDTKGVASLADLVRSHKLIP